MFAFKQSTSNKILVGIFDSTTGLGVTGLAFNAAGLTFKLAKSGAAEATKTLSAPDWIEAGHGWYWVVLSAGDCDTLGIGLLIPLYSGVEGAYPFEVRANLESDVFTRVGAPAGASLAADTAAVKADTAATLARTDVATSTRLAAAGYTAPDNATVGAINTKLGTPAGASVSADIAAVAAGVASANSALAVLRGLTGADSYEDGFEYNGPGGAISKSILRTYNSAANAAAHGVTGLLKTYTMIFGYTGSNLTSLQIAES